jgi:hypothetical protein
MLVPTEGLSDFLVYEASPRGWEPPHDTDQLDDGTRARICRAVEQHLTRLGRWVEFVGYEGGGGKVAPIHTMALRPDGLYMLGEVGKLYGPPVCVLKLPVKVGDRWEGTSSRPDLGKIRFVREVKEVKAVETPAGTFQAVGIEVESVIGGAASAPKDRYWYAPGVGLIQIDRSRTLKSFSRGKD